MPDNDLELPDENSPWPASCPNVIHWSDGYWFCRQCRKLLPLNEAMAGRCASLAQICPLPPDIFL